ncbi:hypothetical protein [Acidianus brierleyi]|uniref:Uncharacterized protein n=1 Tax=Acidianus brierleyi TaxID=41673 RepID=A0A2U9IF37_9CREN|nr:hypothetical protein [Acidianus brierleyi]AWR94658.1 hypothetical protein DFR85_08675 [Acidianus brierleyi]
MSLEDNLKPSIVLVSPSDLEEEIKKIEEEIKSHEQIDVDFQKKIHEEIDNISKSLSWLKIAESQGVWKSKTCKHVSNDTCNAWNISDPEKLGIPVDVIIFNQDGSKKVSVNKFPGLCITCPLYEPKRA